jgi:ZIP family zinc transporter
MSKKALVKPCDHFFTRRITIAVPSVQELTMGNPSDSAGVGTALSIVCCAGLSTAIGSAVVFVPAIARLANHRTLAASLGISAGVMLYLSFVELFTLARANFLAAGHGKNGSYFYTTMGFFSGVLFMMVRSGTPFSHDPECEH